jgi:hypothetical protein
LFPKGKTLLQLTKCWTTYAVLAMGCNAGGACLLLSQLC